MNEAVLGAKESPSAGPMDQIVVPPTGLPSTSVQPKVAPPQSCTSMPRCRLYQACIAFGSLALKKMPPIPVTRFMCTSRGKMRRFAWTYSPSLSTAGSTTHDRMSALPPDPRLRGRPGRVRDGGSWTGTLRGGRRVLETTLLSALGLNDEPPRSVPSRSVAPSPTKPTTVVERRPYHSSGREL